MANIDIKGLDKAELLAALYNNSKPLGLGFLSADAKPMTKEQAQQQYGDGSYDYLNGRVMKIRISGDTMDPWGYDRDNGEGAAAKAVEAVRKGQTSAPDNTKKFGAALNEFIADARGTTSRSEGNVTTLDLGIEPDLLQALKQARDKFRTPEEKATVVGRDLKGLKPPKFQGQ